MTKRRRGHELNKAVETDGLGKREVFDMHTITDGNTSTAAPSTGFLEGSEGES